MCGGGGAAEAPRPKPSVANWLASLTDGLTRSGGQLRHAHPVCPGPACAAGAGISAAAAAPPAASQLPPVVHQAQALMAALMSPTSGVGVALKAAHFLNICSTDLDLMLSALPEVRRGVAGCGVWDGGARAGGWWEAGAARACLPFRAPRCAALPCTAARFAAWWHLTLTSPLIAAPPPPAPSERACGEATPVCLPLRPEPAGRPAARGAAGAGPAAPARGAEGSRARAAAGWPRLRCRASREGEPCTKDVGTGCCTLMLWSRCLDAPPPPPPSPCHLNPCPDPAAHRSTPSSSVPRRATAPSSSATASLWRM